MIAVYMPAAYGAVWHYCSYSCINLPLQIITFCFYTASAKTGSSQHHNKGGPKAAIIDGDAQG